MLKRLQATLRCTLISTKPRERHSLGLRTQRGQDKSISSASKTSRPPKSGTVSLRNIDPVQFPFTPLNDSRLSFRPSADERPVNEVLYRPRTTFQHSQESATHSA